MAQRADEHSDDALIKRAQQGDQGAFTSLFTSYSPRVSGLIRRGGGLDDSTVNDIVQDAFMAAFLSIHKFELGNSFRSWLFQIAKHKKSEHGRRMGRRPVVPLSEPDSIPSRNSNPLDEVIMQEIRSKAINCLDKLPERFRYLYSLFVKEGWSYQECAEHLDRPIGTIGTLLANARDLLRKCLRDSIPQGMDNQYLDDLLRAALEEEERWIRAEMLPSAIVEFQRRLELLRQEADHIPSSAEPSQPEESCPLPETLEVCLVTYLLERSGEPASKLRAFLDEIIPVPRAAGERGGEAMTLSPVPIPASRLADAGLSYWSPGAMDAGAALGSPTHPDLVSRGVVRLVDGRVEIDCAGFPTDGWVLLVVELGETEDVPLENLVALHRPAGEMVAQSALELSAMDLLMRGMILDAWEAATSSRRTPDALTCFKYMVLSQARMLAGEALDRWDAGWELRTPGSHLSRFAEIPLWIDQHRRTLLNRKILGTDGGDDKGVADE
jgi:RNA polymerase sigma-70 factor (ECF subfamily)